MPSVVNSFYWSCIIKIKFCSLSSGSKGNCYFLQSERSKLLIDAGLSLRQLEARLYLIGVAPNEIDAVIISHEHIDHVRGAANFSHKFGTKIYINYPTLKAAANMDRASKIIEFGAGEEFTINDLNINPFSISHDAVDPVAFSITADNKKVGIATDLGVATNLVKTNLQGCDLLLIESNHDYDMLINGPYPWAIKQRILGRQGHLSNKDTLELISNVICEKTSFVMLAHISETNNNEDKVRKDVMEPYKKKNKDNVTFMITNQHKPVGMVEL